MALGILSGLLVVAVGSLARSAASDGNPMMVMGSTERMHQEPVDAMERYHGNETGSAQVGVPL